MSNEVLGNILYFVIAFTWVSYLAQEVFISGASALNLSISKDESERKQIQATSGLHFDGMEVWLIVAIALTFGVFPLVFGELLSHLYVVFFLLLYALIARGVSIEVIYKLDNKTWQKIMIIAWTVSSILIMFLIGVYVTNLFYGFPYENGEFTSGFMSVLSVTGISGGVFFVVLSFVAGAGWINFTTTGDIGPKAIKFIKKVGIYVMVPIALMLTLMGLNNTNASFLTGDIYASNPVWFILPALTIIFALLVLFFGYKENGNKMLLFAVLTIVFYLITGFVGSFPNVLLSRTDLSSSLKVVDVIGSRNNLVLILTTVCIFYPIVVGYQVWKYRRFALNIKPNDEA